ncbi:MobV family relaxase [Bordetella bronchiseptica]|uniref:MobV family relaxase n=1 Tax=Bordetella bronchiseptica TaxID=518 RepID=UPI000460E594|nr:MobV family relaxase [Bordetella bronchiseptica]KDD18242.1 plasmid recombination enzyme [Bordetella bronchiseptica MBORD731]
MRQYAILRTQKLKTRTKITAAAGHNLRLRQQSNIDSSRTKLNEILFNSIDVDVAKAASMQEKLTEFYASLGIKERKNNVLMMEFVATASPGFFKGKSIEQIGKWALDQVQFVKNEFGQQLKLAVLHMDETSPHIHFMVSTEMKSLKRYKNQKGEFHKETWSLNADRYDPEFLVGLQDRFAEHNKKWNLVRGVRGSMRKHVPMKKFYRAIDLAMQTDYKPKIDELVNNVEMSLGERLSMQVVRRKIREFLMPYINLFAKQQKAAVALAKLDFHRLQEEIIADRNKLKAGLAEVDARREVYKEAINGRSSDYQAIESLTVKNQKLEAELARMKRKYEPDGEVMLVQPGLISGKNLPR